MLKTENIFYKHYKTGNIYRVISRDKQMECPVTQMWLNAVEYEEYLHLEKDGTYKHVSEPKRYIRSDYRFSNSFIPWKEDGKENI